MEYAFDEKSNAYVFGNHRLNSAEIFDLWKYCCTANERRDILKSHMVERELPLIKFYDLYIKLFITYRRMSQCKDNQRVENEKGEKTDENFPFKCVNSCSPSIDKQIQRISTGIQRAYRNMQQQHASHRLSSSTRISSAKVSTVNYTKRPKQTSLGSQSLEINTEQNSALDDDENETVKSANATTSHCNQKSKGFSCQDLHSQYTKRRYGHVSSRVGQYIAQFKAEDERARNARKFERHRSMPGALMGPMATTLASKFESELKKRVSLSDLCKINISPTANSELDGEMEADVGVDSSENVMGTTMTSSTHSNGGSSSSGVNGCGSSGVSGSGPLHETSADTEFLTKLLDENDRIKSYNDHLQNMVDEKSSEIVRLKRNMDVLRIELDNCKDKLKLRGSVSLDYGGYNSSYFYGSHRSSLPYATHYMSSYNLSHGVISKATQTDAQLPSILIAEYQQQVVLTPQRSQSMRVGKIYLTPTRKLLDMTTDKNNNRRSGGTSSTSGHLLGYNERNVDEPYGRDNTLNAPAAMQPLSLHYNSPRQNDSEDMRSRTNSIVRRRSNSNQSNKPQNFVMLRDANSSVNDIEKSSDIEPSETTNVRKSLFSRSKVKFQKYKKQRQTHMACPRVDEEEFVYFDMRHMNTARNDNSTSTNVDSTESNQQYNTSIDLEYDAVSTSTQRVRNRNWEQKKRTQRKSLRKRFLHFFAPCCTSEDHRRNHNHNIFDNLNNSNDMANGSQQLNATEVTLLNTSNI